MTKLYSPAAFAEAFGFTEDQVRGWIRKSRPGVMFVKGVKVPIPGNGFRDCYIKNGAGKNAPIHIDPMRAMAWLVERDRRARKEEAA